MPQTNGSGGARTEEQQVEKPGFRKLEMPSLPPKIVARQEGPMERSSLVGLMPGQTEYIDSCLKVICLILERAGAEHTD